MNFDTKELRSYHAWEERAPNQDLELLRKAADHIDAQAAEIERLRMALTELTNAVGGISPGDEPDVYADYDELHRLLSQARAALSGEPTC